MKDYKKEKDKLLELKKKLLILGLLTTGPLTLTSCTNATGDSNSYIVQESLQDEISSDAEKGSTKTFESGEHYLCVQVPQKQDFNGNEVPVKAIDNSFFEFFLSKAFPSDNLWKNTTAIQQTINNKNFEINPNKK